MMQKLVYLLGLSFVLLTLKVANGELIDAKAKKYTPLTVHPFSRFEELSKNLDDLYVLTRNSDEVKCDGKLKLKFGHMAFVHYKSYILDPKTEKEKEPFEDSRARGSGPFFFKLTPTWNGVPGVGDGILGACAGQSRRILVPAELAYGSEGTEDGTIGPDTNIYVDVDIFAAKTRDDHEMEWNMFNWLFSRDFDEASFLEERFEVDIANGLNINCFDQDGKSLLHWAAMKNFTMLAERLLREEHIDVEKTFATGITPLFYAAGEGNIHILKLLLDKGANVNAELTAGAVKGYTPLHFACLKGEVESVKVLILAGAKRNVRAANGLTPLRLLENFLKEKTHMKQNYAEKENGRKMIKKGLKYYEEIKQLLQNDNDEL